mmetsp:Transcript_14876/g.42689  ORF Transcript_14876/g.42689 Transcript_14876/m.42689 type:complete len:369 (-) Transcript_14876:94-1200(-)
MVTEASSVQATSDRRDLSPESLSAKGLWEEVEHAVKGVDLCDAAPHCERVRRMVRMHCFTLCHPSSQSDIQELWSAEADVEEFAGLSVVEPVREIARRLMWSVEEECATGPVEVHLRSSSAMHFEDTHALCEQLLRPQLGNERSEAVWSMCHECAWEVQRQKQRRHDEADVHRLWAEHYARRMGFDDGLMPVPGNHALVALCHRLCRHWTGANVTDGMGPCQGLKLREAAFEIALKEAKEAIPLNVVDIVLDMQREMRRGMHLNRLTDRRNPRQVLTNLLSNTAGQANAAFENARSICDEQLVPLLGSDRATEVQSMCHRCSWHEQNRYDYESAIGGRLTGAREGYLRDARGDWAAVLEHSAGMGFGA